MTALLRAEGVAKAFGGVQALQDCTVEVEQGTIAGLIGPNGSGKTTLFNIMTGFERVDSGDVYLGDKKITNRPPQRVFALGIGRTFQLTRIFPRLTVLENMLIAAQHGAGVPATRWPGRAATRSGGAPSNCWSSPASPTTQRRSPTRCPTGSASCSSCPTFWWPIPRSCCSTSRPAG